MPREMPPEVVQIENEYSCLFGERPPYSFVGFARIYEAIRTKTPVLRSEYEKFETLEVDPPTHCMADTPEEEQLILEYERMFNEKCPIEIDDYERIKKAIAEKKPVSKSERERILERLLKLL